MALGLAVIHCEGFYYISNVIGSHQMFLPSISTRVSLISLIFKFLITHHLHLFLLLY